MANKKGIHLEIPYNGEKINVWITLTAQIEDAIQGKLSLVANYEGEEEIVSPDKTKQPISFLESIESKSMDITNPVKEPIKEPIWDPSLYEAACLTKGIKSFTDLIHTVWGISFERAEKEYNKYKTDQAANGKRAMTFRKFCGKNYKRIGGMYYKHKLNGAEATH